ncbi:uncharacterized protein [Ranitomeya imitator]|uniref:uncharacterized protein n=1 Tax=Ranitomeya imitator TaxID=111125 RepID=UPI0037E84971
MESQHFSAFSSQVADSVIDELIRTIPDNLDEFTRNTPDAVDEFISNYSDDFLNGFSVPTLECDTPGAEYSNTNAGVAAVWDLTQGIIDVDMFPEPTTTEHNQPPVEELMYQTPTPRNSPDSRAPKKQLGPGGKKGRACKLKPRRIFTKENIPELMESIAEAAEDATAIIHHTSLSPKRKVMRKTPPAPLQPLQITENGAAQAWPAIQTANGSVRAYPLSPICVVQDAGNPVPSDHREIPHSSTGQPSTIRVNDPAPLYPEVLEAPRKHKRKTKHVTESPTASCAVGATATMSREEYDREIDQLADGKQPSIEPLIIRMSHTMQPSAPCVTGPANASGAGPSGSSNLGDISHVCVSNSVNVKKRSKRSRPADVKGCKELKMCKKPRIHAPAIDLQHESRSWDPVEMLVFQEHIGRYLRYKRWVPKIMFFCDTFEKLLLTQNPTQANKSELYALRSLLLDGEITTTATPL